MADPTTSAVAQPAPGAADHEAWAGLRRLTAARIGLQRSGASLATGPMLELRLAHARARDAVHARLDEARLRAGLALGLPVIAVASAVRDRPQYLMRPDLGRQLAPIQAPSWQSTRAAATTWRWWSPTACRRARSSATRRRF